MLSSAHTFSMRVGLLIASLMAIVCVSGCTEGDGSMHLYCGAGIRPPAEELCDAFEKKHGVKIAREYNGSEILFNRVKMTGQGDLLMPGDVHYVEMADQAGLVTKYETVCYFVPAMLVQKDNPKDLKSLHDLTKPGLKLGLGNPEACAVGRKTRKMLKKNDITEEQIGPNVKFSSVTVNELGNALSLKHLDAVIVWDAVAANYPHCTMVPIPHEENIISTVPIATLKSSKNPELAEKFLEFASSDEGRAIFKKHNYTTELPE